MDQVGIDRSAERNLLAVGRPRQVTDAEVFPARVLLAGGGIAERLGNVERPKVAVLVLATHDVERAHVLVPRFRVGALGFRRDVRNAPAAGRPHVVGHTCLRVREPDRFAASWTDGEDLRHVVVARGHERKPLSSGRNTARAAVGGEFPTRTLSVVRRDPSSTIAHVSASPPLIPDSRISRVRLAAAAFPRGPSQAPRSLSTRLHTPLGCIVIPPARHHWNLTSLYLAQSPDDVPK